MKNIKIIIFSIFLFYSYQLSAWGNRAHKLIGTLTEDIIKKQVSDSVHYYLRDISFEDASVWMDEVRSDQKYDYLKPTHYINIDKDKTYVKVPGDNIMNEMDIAIALIKKKSSIEDVKFGLKLLFHLVGDLHQPLHTGYLEDKGGNKVEVLFDGKTTNLHKLWDSEIMEKYSEEIIPNTLISLKGLIGPIQKEEINTVKWLEESRGYLKDVYSFNSKNEIDEAYIKKAKGIITKQITKASIRMANIINKYFF